MSHPGILSLEYSRASTCILSSLYPPCFLIICVGIGLFNPCIQVENYKCAHSCVTFCPTTWAFWMLLLGSAASRALSQKARHCSPVKTDVPASGTSKTFSVTVSKQTPEQRWLCVLCICHGLCWESGASVSPHPGTAAQQKTWSVKFCHQTVLRIYGCTCSGVWESRSVSA